MKHHDTVSSAAPLTWKRWLSHPVESWQACWFRPVPLLRLALVRIIFVACQLLFFMSPLHYQRMLIERNDGFMDPQAIIRAITAIVPEHLFRTTETITAIWSVTLLAGLFALVGLLTRPALFVFAVGNAVLVAHGFSYGTQHHPQALFTIVLFLLAFSPCGAVLSLDAWRQARGRAGDPRTSLDGQRRLVSSFAWWPLLSAQWLLALAYLNAGLCKLHMGGLMWFNGYTMQAHLLDDAIRWNRPLGLWVAQQWELAVVISIFAVAFEVLFPLVLVFRRLVPLFVIAGLSMHLGIFILQAAPFWQFMLLYLAFIPLERVWDWARRSQPLAPVALTESAK